MGKLNQHIETNTVSCTNNRSDIDTFIDEIAEMKRRIELKNEAYEVTMAETTEQVAMNIVECTNIRADIDAHHADLTDMRRRITACNTAISNSNSEIEGLTAEIDSYIGKLRDEMRLETAATDDRIDRRKNEHLELRKEI